MDILDIDFAASSHVNISQYTILSLRSSLALRLQYQYDLIQLF